MSTAGAALDAAGKALLAEDLRSPCTEEIAVFRAFAQVVAEGQDQFVVLDTAPTGHTILLLDAALAYHKEVARQTSQMPDSVSHLLPRLRNPEFTRVLIINQSLAPLTVSDPILQSRQRHEWKFIHEVVDQQARRAVLIKWQSEPPTGVKALETLLT